MGDEAKYGWTLTDGNAESFFIGAGRRRYDNGKILNIYNPLPKVRSDAMEAQPWEGLYWTTAVSRTQAAALHFWFEKLDTSAGIENSVPYARSQRPSGALCEAAGQVGTSDTTGGPATCRPALLWYNTCCVGV